MKLGGVWAVPLVLFVVGLYAAVLWLPLLGFLIWLLVRQPKCRRMFGVLGGGWMLCLALLLGGWTASERWGVRLRDWLVTGPAGLSAVIAVGLFALTAWYGGKQLSRRWKRRLLCVGSALSVLAVASWSVFWIGLTASAETVGTWEGQKVVMQRSTWMETSYSYYQYQGPFVLGDYLGSSLSPWAENKDLRGG